MKLREFGQPISATKKLLRWLYPDVRRKVDRVKFGGGGVLQKNQATYVPYGPDAGHHHIAVGKGSDLNVLWHEAGHHKDRESLRKILKSGDVPRWKSELKADNNAEALLRKFGGDVSHYRKMRKTPVGLIKDQGNWINDPVSGYDLSAKLRLREFVRVMGGADIPASMSQIRSVWRTFKNAAPGKIVRSTTQGSSFGPRGMVVQKAASGAKIDREALLAGATNTTNYPITSALHEGGHALFNKAMTGSANQQFLPRLGRGPTPEKHPLRGVQIMANEIGANNSAVQVLRGAGVKQDAVSDFMKFRQRGIDSHMRSARDHVAAAPVGLTPQRHQEIKGAFNRWITDWKRSPASPNAKLSVDAPELVKKDFEAAKLRLRELARGDYAIPALGKMLKDRSMLEEFLTGKRGPKLGDLVVGNAAPQPIRAAAHHVGRRQVERRPNYAGEVDLNKIMKAESLWGFPGDRDLIFPMISNGRMNSSAKLIMNRQEARNKVAKMIRKGRAGGDVYEELSAKLRLRELARGDYAIPALGKMLKDRSMLEEFMTGKRGPKMGDLRHNFNGGITDDRKLAGHTHGRKKSIHGYSPVAKDLIVGYGIPDRPFVANARQKGRDAIAKIIRKGRAGGDVYEEINRP